MADKVITVFDPNQPISSANPVPTSVVSQLSAIGVPSGVTYQAANYSQPGVTTFIGGRPMTRTPGNPADVALSTIVRAG